MRGKADMSKIAPSILAANSMHMADAVELIQKTGCDWVHFDVMDGVFVPNISFGPSLLKDMHQEYPSLYYDVHLMLINPLQYIDKFAKSGANIITVHAESETYLPAVTEIRKQGCKVGVSLKPSTPISVLSALEQQPDLILIMSVEPGFGGQQMKTEVIQKIRDLRASGYKGEIEVDGGINLDNAKLLTDAGASILVMGTAFFQAKDPKAVVEYIHSL